MSCPVVFITIPYSAVKNTIVPEYDMETGINILVDSIDIDMPVLIDLAGRCNFHFIFSLSNAVLNDNNLNNLLPSLYTLFTLSRCFANCNNSIPVYTSNPSQASLQPIKDYFTGQREKIGFTLVGSAEAGEVKNATLFIHYKQLNALNEHQLLQFTEGTINQVILSPDTAQASIKSLKKENKYVDIFLKIVALNNSANWQVQESELWQNRAKLYLSFIALGKEVAQKEYYDLREWYHGEYEILPLWYKRLGHIIKVLIGKRTFRSLFSDNVKKTPKDL